MRRPNVISMVHAYFFYSYEADVEMAPINVNRVFSEAKAANLLPFICKWL